MRRCLPLLLLPLALAGCDAITPFEATVPGRDEGEMEPDAPDPRDAVIRYTNDGYYEVVEIYASPCSDTEWSGEMSVSIYPGETYERTVSAPECYDLAAVYADNTFDERYDLQVRAGGTYDWTTKP